MSQEQSQQEGVVTCGCGAFWARAGWGFADVATPGEVCQLGQARLLLKAWDGEGSPGR